MSVTADIRATYRGPGRIMAELLARGPREDRALAFLMAFCIIMFVAQLPRLSREAHLNGDDLNMLMGATLLAWVIIAPLLLYIIAGGSHLVLRLMGTTISGYGARLALFWSLLATTPALLLHGLVAGFIGQGPGLQIVGFVWFALFVWFWASCLRQAARHVT